MRNLDGGLTHPLRHPLDPIFEPRSVAVVGASATAGSVGNILMRNLLENPFGGVVYPVNPKRHAVHGVRCYPDLAAIPEVVDLAVIATPAAGVPEVVRQCSDRGIPGAVVISAGFAELGPSGRELEARTRDASQGKVRVIGPNCLGVIRPPRNLNASFASGSVAPGRVALLSQSGAICTSILDWAAEKHVGFSAFVSVGSMLDVDFADLIDYFADDAATRSIILYMESVGDVRKFLSAARSVGRTKQIIVVKAGRHEAGARAAASHTGALAGADAVFDAAFRRAGILRVATIGELFDMSEILALQPPPHGRALAIVTNAGGPGVMATDALMLAGGQVAALAPKTVAALNAALPPFWSHSNPVDVLGDATPDRYRIAAEECVRDPAADGLLVLLTPQAMTDPTATARAVSDAVRNATKPVLACWMGGATVRPGRDVLAAAGIPTFDAPEPAIAAFLHMADYSRNQELLYETPQAIPGDWRPETAEVRSIFAQARAAGRLLLTEVEAKAALAAYGLPVTPAVQCDDADRAVAAANHLGYPVVLKLSSTTLTHKTDDGGVQLNLSDEAAVRAAFATIRDNVARLARPEAFEGVTVQPMIRDRGLELIVGSSVDRQFGPVILFGTGGVLVEVVQDRALALPPLNRALARRLMERTKIYPALKGVRGQRPVDLEALEALLVRFGQFLVDFPEVAEVDMNPVLASPERVQALDARVLLAPPDAPRPRLAIHPFPNRYTAPFTLRNGSTVTVRALGPEDEPLIVAMHGRHSEHTLRMRYFGLVKTLSRDSLIRLCHLDYDREMALTAVTLDGGTMLGVSRYYLRPETGEAEFALIVSDAYQGQGLGRHLLERLIAVARERGARKLTGQVLVENTAMLELVRTLNFREAVPPRDGVAVVDLSLQ
jgi:acetyltransferase